MTISSVVADATVREVRRPPEKVSSRADVDELGDGAGELGGVRGEEHLHDGGGLLAVVLHACGRLVRPDHADADRHQLADAAEPDLEVGDDVGDHGPQRLVRLDYNT